MLGLGISAQFVVAAIKPLRPAAFGLLDSDGDGIPDIWERKLGYSDPYKSDTDGDGYDDWTELINEYNPSGSGRLVPRDYDHDGLDDRVELLLGTDPTHPDTATSSSIVPLQKSIRIILSKQQLQQRLGGVTLATHVVSTGRAGLRTPTGTFHVLSKTPRAWSRSAGLWMPWWLQFTQRGHGIHELPEWPSGIKEGANHLGRPVSHGCVRLGVGAAQRLYAWAPIGTKVEIVL